MENNPLSLFGRGHFLEDRVGQRLHINRGSLHLCPAEAGKGQQVVNQLSHALGLMTDDGADPLAFSIQSSLVVFDHHLETKQDILATEVYIEPVGATTTLIVERLQQLEANTSKLIRDRSPENFLTPAEATIMALAIHADTGSLTFDHSTARDARALAWLMERGASLSAIAEYAKPSFSPELQNLLKHALDKLERKTVRTYDIAWVFLETKEFVAGLSSLTSQLMDLTETDAILLGNSQFCQAGEETRIS